LSDKLRAGNDGKAEGPETFVFGPFAYLYCAVSWDGLPPRRNKPQGAPSRTTRILIAAKLTRDDSSDSRRRNGRRLEKGRKHDANLGDGHCSGLPISTACGLRRRLGTIAADSPIHDLHHAIAALGDPWIVRHHQKRRAELAVESALLARNTSSLEARSSSVECPSPPPPGSITFSSAVNAGKRW